jgi:hypothetical protein
MARTPTHPPTHPGMWRRLVSRAHPDTGGDHDLFIWTMATRDAICGGELGPEIPKRERRDDRQDDRPRRKTWSSSSAARIPFETGTYAPFVALKNRALEIAHEVEDPYKHLLYALLDCVEAEDGPLYKMQNQGATYKSLAAIAYKAGMSQAERVQWYRICESVPISQRLAGHILSKLQKAAA